MIARRGSLVPVVIISRSPRAELVDGSVNFAFEFATASVRSLALSVLRFQLCPFSSALSARDNPLPNFL